MPKNTKMFSNTEALQRGNDRAKWKQEMTLNYFRGANYRKETGFGFDFRDMYSLIPLIVDMSSVIDQPEEVQKEYFISELKQIEDAFVFSKGPVPGMPDPERIKPYLRRMYETIATNYDIDWDNEASIDNLFCSILAQQAIGTMVEKFPRQVFELYPTKEESARLDNISLTSYANISNLRNMIAKTNPDLLRNIRASAVNSESHGSNVESELNLAFSKATMDGSNIAVIDPSKSQITKMHFLGDKFSVNDLTPLDPTDPTSVTKYTSEEADIHYLDFMLNVAGKTINEYSVTNSVTNGNASKQAEFLFINGKSVQELIEETQQQNENMNSYQAKMAVGKMLREAMTDGKSIVTLMRPTLTPEGKVSFRHQEVKVDLDKLNKIERYEKHNAFRRALDYVGLWKLKPKFASNDARDAMQAEMKNQAEYKNAIKSAEDKFIRDYNETAKSQATHNNFLKAFPEITREENVNENQLEVNEPEQVRESIVVNEVIEAERNIAREPMDEALDKSLNLNDIVK